MQIVPIPAFSDNYIWLLSDDASNKVCVVDPGDAQPVLDYCAAHQKVCDTILITHHHPDHQGGIPGILRHFPALNVVGPKQEKIQHCTQPVAHGAVVSIPYLQTQFEVIAVPGHTAGHIAFADAAHLFCGDTLFSAGCGRLFEGSAAQMHDSLQQLMARAPETKIYPAHEYTLANLAFAQAVEPDNRAIQDRIEDVQRLRAQGHPSLPSTIAIERDTNPFCRIDKPSVIEAAVRQDPRCDASDAVSVFATIRQWKNVF